MNNIMNSRLQVIFMVNIYYFTMIFFVYWFLYCVFAEPPTVVVTLPNYQTDFGNSVTLGCTVTANPIHTIVYWRKIVNGVSTNINVGSSGGKYSGSTVSSPSLVVNNANLDDRASYVCYAENSIGVGQSTSTVLNVLGGNILDYLMDLLKPCV